MLKFIFCETTCVVCLSEMTSEIVTENLRQVMGLGANPAVTRDGIPLFDGDESKFVMWRNDFKAFAMIKKFRSVLDRADRERSKVDQDGSSEAASGSDSGSSGSSGSSVDGKADDGKKNEKTKKMMKMNMLAYSYLLRALTENDGDFER